MFCEFRSKILAAEKELAANRQDNTTLDVPAQSSIKKTSKSKYENDVEALKSHYGESFKMGLSIETSLNEILEIVDRKRRRIESFSGLINYLQKEYGVTLNIKSRRTK